MTKIEVVARATCIRLIVFHSVTTKDFINYLYLLNDHLKPESFLNSFFHNSVLFQYIYYYYNITVKSQKSDNNKKTKNLLYTLSITSTTYTVEGFIYLRLHILEEISELPMCFVLRVM